MMGSQEVSDSSDPAWCCKVLNYVVNHSLKLLDTHWDTHKTLDDVEAHL